MPKLTKRTIEALDVRESDYFVWDSELSGFGVRVLPSGRKKFVLQYRYGKTSRGMGIGQFGAITVDQARGLALQGLAKLRQDIDPLAEVRERRTAITVKELSERFDAEHIAVHLKATTAKEYRRNLKLFILPAIGQKRTPRSIRPSVRRLPRSPRLSGPGPHWSLTKLVRAQRPASPFPRSFESLQDTPDGC